jgi:hypothetical protein
VPSFLVESYVAHATGTDIKMLAALARSGAAAGVRSGIPVRHVRSFLAPDDEICFHVFEAPSRQAVARMTELVNLDHERITEVIE